MPFRLELLKAVTGISLVHLYGKRLSKKRPNMRQSWRNPRETERGRVRPRIVRWPHLWRKRGLSASHQPVSRIVGVVPLTVDNFVIQSVTVDTWIYGQGRIVAAQRGKHLPGGLEGTISVTSGKPAPAPLLSDFSCSSLWLQGLGTLFAFRHVSPPTMGWTA